MKGGVKVTRAKQSKVCIVANSLVKQGFSRSAAMVRAWILVKLPQLTTRVKGVTYKQRQRALEHLGRYSRQDIAITLLHEPHNKHDENAVAVVATVKGKGSYTMGYLPKGLAALIAPLLAGGKAIESLYTKVRKCCPSLPYGLEIAIRA